MGLGLEATLPLDTLYLLTLHWAIQRLRRLQWTVRRRLLRLNKDSIVHIQYSFIK